MVCEERTCGKRAGLEVTWAAAAGRISRTYLLRLIQEERRTSGVGGWFGWPGDDPDGAFGEEFVLLCAGGVAAVLAEAAADAGLGVDKGGFD